MGVAISRDSNNLELAVVIYVTQQWRPKYQIVSTLRPSLQRSATSVEQENPAVHDGYRQFILAIALKIRNGHFCIDSASEYHGPAFHQTRAHREAACAGSV
jgi:hypothetical protein